MMAQKKKYKIFCITEDCWVPGFTVADEPPETCPNNVEHQVKVESISIDELIALNNLSATVNPTSNDDVNDGYIVGSKWINTNTNTVFTCTSNDEANAIWHQSSSVPPGSGGCFAQFSFNHEMDYDQYLVSWADDDIHNQKLKRSGHEDGMENGDCAPIIIPVDATIVSAILTMKGGSVSGGTVGSTVLATFELWNVGWTSEGTKVADLIFTIDTSSNPLGQWWNPWQQDANLVSSISVNANLNVGDRLAIKFKQGSGSENLCTALGTSIILTWDAR